MRRFMEFFGQQHQTPNGYGSNNLMGTVNIIEAKDANLTGAPMPGDRYSYEGHPVSSVVAYTMSHQSPSDDPNVARIISPFAAEPKFHGSKRQVLKDGIIRAAAAIKEYPDKEVWAVEMHNGDVAIYIGDYGCVKASVTVGKVTK